jgi:hypothetical protein
MKAVILTVPMLLLAAGAASAQALPPLPSEYYPLKKGERWTYQVTDLKKTPAKVDPKMKVDVVVEKEEVYTRNKMTKDGKPVFENGKQVVEKFTGFLLKSTSGQNSKADHVVVLEDGIYRVHTAEVPLTPPLQIFKMPLKPGEAWVWEANSTSGKEVIKGTFTARLEKITVPAGTYNAIAIRFVSDPSVGTPFEFTNWFVPKIGMAKHHVKSKDHERLLELQSYSGAK